MAMIASHFSTGNSSTRRDVLDAGIIDEDVDAPERLRRLLDQRAAFVRLRHVGADIDGLDRHAACAIVSASAWSSRLSVKELRTTLQPSAASASAMARPMPEVDPVTIAVFPFGM